MEEPDVKDTRQPGCAEASADDEVHKRLDRMEDLLLRILDILPKSSRRVGATYARADPETQGLGLSNLSNVKHENSKESPSPKVAPSADTHSFEWAPSSEKKPAPPSIHHNDELEHIRKAKENRSHKRLSVVERQERRIHKSKETLTLTKQTKPATKRSMATQKLRKAIAKINKVHTLRNLENFNDIPLRNLYKHDIFGGSKSISQYIFHPKSQGVQAWDLFMSLLLAITLYLTPLSLAFDTLDTDILYLNVTIDCLFLLDIVKNFNTGYMNENDLIVLQVTHDLVARRLRRSILFTNTRFVDLTVTPR